VMNESKVAPLFYRSCCSWARRPPFSPLGHGCKARLHQRRGHVMYRYLLGLILLILLRTWFTGRYVRTMSALLTRVYCSSGVGPLHQLCSVSRNPSDVVWQSKISNESRDAPAWHCQAFTDPIYVIEPHIEAINVY